MTQNKFLDEVNKMGEKAFSSLLHAKDSLVNVIKEQVEALMPKDLVSREEFEGLKKRIEALEKKPSSSKKS
jgi:BMFP domain-containing protein YqiC